MRGRLEISFYLNKLLFPSPLFPVGLGLCFCVCVCVRACVLYVPMVCIAQFFKQQKDFTKIFEFGAEVKV